MSDIPATSNPFAALSEDAAVPNQSQPTRAMLAAGAHTAPALVKVLVTDQYTALGVDETPPPSPSPLPRPSTGLTSNTARANVATGTAASMHAPSASALATPPPTQTDGNQGGQQDEGRPESSKKRRRQGTAQPQLPGRAPIGTPVLPASQATARPSNAPPQATQATSVNTQVPPVLGQGLRAPPAQSQTAATAPLATPTFPATNTEANATTTATPMPATGDGHVAPAAPATATAAPQVPGDAMITSRPASPIANGNDIPATAHAAGAIHGAAANPLPAPQAGQALPQGPAAAAAAPGTGPAPQAPTQAPPPVVFGAMPPAAAAAQVQPQPPALGVHTGNTMAVPEFHIINTLNYDDPLIRQEVFPILRTANTFYEAAVRVAALATNTAIQPYPPPPVSITPRPASGWPSISWGDPLGPFDNLSLDVIHDWLSNDVGQAVGLIWYDHGCPKAEKTMDRVAHVQFMLKAITGVDDFEVAVPQPMNPLTFNRDGETKQSPFLHLVYNIPRGLKHFLLERFCFSTPAWTIFFVPMEVRSPSLLLSLKNFSTRKEDLLRSHIIKTWEASALLDVLTPIFASDPNLQGADPQAYTTNFIHSVRVNVLDTKSSGDMADPTVNIFATPVTNRIDLWRVVKNFLAGLNYRHMRLGNPTIAENMKCSGCHANDHPRGLCPFPTVPGWNGPTATAVVATAPEQPIATFTTVAAPAPPPPPPSTADNGTRGRGRGRGGRGRGRGTRGTGGRGRGRGTA